ncbi:MAG TPA: ABC transporter permease [Actinomycetales bacterium]|nr:ABC transporter permease [Actinomycetales bacterium]
MPWLLLTVAVVVSAVLRNNFFSQYSMASTFATFVPLVLVAVGQAVVVIGGGLDLSIGAIAALSSVTAITVMGGENSRIILGFLVAVGTGAACGAVNGLIVAGLRLQPLITTFATAAVFSGMTLWVLPTPGGRVPPGITATFRMALAGIPVTVLLVLAVGGLWLMLRRTRLVRHIYAMGGDPLAAYNSLVPVRRTQALSYVLAGAFAGLAGLAILANSGSGDPFIGSAMALDSVAAVVIGGIALRGGIGGPIGAMAGAMVLSLAASILFFAGVPTTYRPLASGLVVIAALALSALTDRRKG